jgi:hypothetical protein
MDYRHIVDSWDATLARWIFFDLLRALKATINHTQPSRVRTMVVDHAT